MSDNVLWIVHASTGARVRFATKSGKAPWHFRSDNEIQREFDQFADAVATHAKKNWNADANFVLELLDATNSPYCFGVNQTPVKE